MTAEERSGREIRLLVLVIGIAVAVLLILARLRFPAVDLSANPPTPGPLERLAARATFEDLASALGDVATRVTRTFVVATIERIPDKPEGRNAQPLQPIAPSQRWVPALRIRSDLLFAPVPTGMRVVSIEGWSASPQVGALDDGREVALIRVPSGNNPIMDFSNTAGDFVGSTFVVAVEGALGGPSVRPVFVPRVDALFESRWSTTLQVIGGEPDIRPGVFLFTLDGRFIGLTVRQEPGVALVPASTLDRVITEMANRIGGGEK